MESVTTVRKIVLLCCFKSAIFGLIYSSVFVNLFKTDHEVEPYSFLQIFLGRNEVKTFPGPAH